MDVIHHSSGADRTTLPMRNDDVARRERDEPGDAGNYSDDDAPQWPAPAMGPEAVTLVAPAICFFHGALFVAWTVPGVGWIMGSVRQTNADGSYGWSAATRLGSGTTNDAPAVAEFGGPLSVAWRDSIGNAVSYATFTSLSEVQRGAEYPNGWVLTINNAVTGSGIYTAQLMLGSQFTQVSMIVDTGSSALAGIANTYSGAGDAFLTSTGFAQFVQYGNGSQLFYGPVVQTFVTLPVRAWRCRLRCSGST